MRRRFNFFYFLGEGAKNVTTHGAMSFASICMIAACLIIMGSLSLVAVNLNGVLDNMESENEFTAYIDESYSTEESMAIQSAIEAVPNVKEAIFVTREEALETFKSQYSNSALLENLPSTVLRDRYEIFVHDINQLGETTVAVSNIEGVDDINADFDVAHGFITIRNIVSIVMVILVAILAIVSLFIISNTVRLATFHRKDEIAIMKMCGATNGFIRWPFVFEGCILGLIGAVVAFFAQWGIYTLIERGIGASDTINLISLIPFISVALYVGVVFLVVAFVIGVFGSLIAIRKFLQV